MSELLLSSVMAVNSPRLGDDFVSETLRIIDSVHSIEGLQCPSETEILWPTGNGETVPWGEFRPGESLIFLEPDYEFKDFTLLHELGHFIDWYADNGSWFVSQVGDEYQEWIQAVRLSEWCTRLQQIWPRLPAPQKRRLEVACLPTEELWARSYQQFVAHRSSAIQFMEPLIAFLSLDPNKFEVWYWEWEDFSIDRHSRTTDPSASRLAPNLTVVCS